MGRRLDKCETGFRVRRELIVGDAQGGAGRSDYAIDHAVIAYAQAEPRGGSLKRLNVQVFGLRFGGQPVSSLRQHKDKRNPEAPAGLSAATNRQEASRNKGVLGSTAT